MTECDSEPGSDPRLLINIFGRRNVANKQKVEEKRTRRTFKEKQNWIIARLDAEWEREKRWSPTTPYAPCISSSDDEDEEAWHAEFGGYRKYYTMGPCVSPDFARTLLQMHNNGILYRSTAGNQGAREGGYAQKTYYVSYRMKSHHREALEIRIKCGTEPDDQ